MAPGLQARVLVLSSVPAQALPAKGTLGPTGMVVLPVHRAVGEQWLSPC